MTPRRPSRAALAPLALALLASCTTPRTQIILLVDTDMAQGPNGPLTHVRITVKSPASGAVRQRLTYPLRRAVNGQSFELPGTLGIAALDNDGARSVEVNVDAVSDPGGDGSQRAAMFTYYAVAPFAEERTTLLSVFLADRCRALARTCTPDETCGLDGCVPRVQSSLPEVSPGFRPDASARDAVADVNPDDAPDAHTDATIDIPHDVTIDLPVDADAPVVDAGCPAGQTRCGGACVDPATDLAHCGACDARCPAGAHATTTCAAGRCGLSCAQGFADCDVSAANGCEVDLGADARHCGACGAACSTRGAASECRAGACRLTCAAGFGDCDRDVSNGCETGIASAAHCGACGAACELPHVATQACASGACAVGACAAGWADCDRAAANGCEVDTANNGAHCGGCGRACGAGMVCNAGACATSCATGLVACGAACVNVASNAAHCGGCDAACPARPNAAATCAAGACGFVCNAGFADCDGNAVNGCEASLSAPATCGACARRCSAANAASTCVGGSCGYTCNAGFGDCDGMAVNACETDTRSAAAHCGRCGQACSLPHATASCAASVCAVASCEAGWANCDGDPANGCETDTRNAAAHCGACRRACALANATAACAGGGCVVSACAAGYGNCNGADADGCEVNLNTDAHCGACGRACAMNTACSRGACVSTCPAGTALCSGACVSTGDSADHCGACGTACATPPSSTPACVGGACTFTCNDGRGDCNRVISDGCEAPLDTTTNCNACGVPCAPPNAMGTCASRVCRVASCSAGWGDCNGAALDGCEQRIDESPMHCGACGNACPRGANATARCAAGACMLDCDEGFEDCDGNPSNGCEARVGVACGTACAPGFTACVGLMQGCMATPRACGSRCTELGVMGFCNLLGLCAAPVPTCTVGDAGGLDAGDTLDAGGPAPGRDSGVSMDGSTAIE
jgi:hypothetical protein